MISKGVKEELILINGIKINYKIAGEGPAILILHGWGSSSESWIKVQEILVSKGFKVICPDLPGFGKSITPPSAWEVEDYSDFILKFIKEIGISQFFLLGHSFGGAVAVKLVLKCPEKVKKMFLVANSGIRKKSLKKEILRKTANFFKAFSFLPFYSLLRKAFYKIFVPKSDYPYLQKAIMREIYLRVINEDISSSFSQVSVPTVIIWGEKDNVLPLKDAYFINQEIKDSELVIIPGADHDLNSKTPEILVEKVLNFCKENGNKTN